MAGDTRFEGPFKVDQPFLGVPHTRVKEVVGEVAIVEFALDGGRAMREVEFIDDTQGRLEDMNL